MKNAQRIIMNQYLTPRLMVSNIKSLLILSALLTVLFIVTACGGAAVAPTLIESPTTDDSCTTDPFGDGCNTAAAETAQDIKITECLAGEAAATSTCESAVKSVPCLTNPFDTACANNADFAKYLAPARTARTTLCTSNPFNGLCTADPVARLAFCRDTGRTTTTKSADCTGTINTACAADRFAQTTGGTPTNLCPADIAADLVFCRDDAKTTPTKADDCTTTIANACINNPFDSLCTPDHAAELAFCNDATKTTPTKTADCELVLSGACRENPFIERCTVDLMARLTFCRDTDATTDTKSTDCTGTITTACTANPFTQTTGTTVGNLCVGNDLPDEDGIADFCRDATKPTDTKTVDCAPTVDRICTAQGTPDPFEVLCGITDEVKIAFCRDGTNAVDRASDCMTVITPLCEANSGDPLCPDDSPDTITAGDWSRSFDAPLNTAPDLDNQKSEFLQVADKTISTGDLQNVREGMQVDAVVHSMDFSTELFDGRAIGGDADNGFTHFNGSINLVDLNTIYHYAGIYGSTDLGAPITDDGFSAEWNGRIQLNSFPTDFVLNVGFDGTDGTLDGFAVNYSRIPDFPDDDGDILIDGTFDENGLISGTVTLDWFTGNVKTGVKLNDGLYEANLTGIIGQEGAVGVFIREGLFAGGFIAGPNIVFNPNVTYSDWTRSFTTTPLNYDPTAENQFLHTTGNVIDVGAAVSQSDVDFFTTAPIKQSLDFSALAYGGVSLGLSADDGLAYFQGEVGGSTYAYAGIFQTTDLGAPITDSSFSATWAGKLQVDTFSMVDFDLTVAFDGADGTLTGVRQNFTGFRDFIIDGKFDAKGVITGKVHNQTLVQEITLAHPLRNGTLSGLIGQEGAVGVFHGTSGGSGYSGGFVASPVATICVKDVFDTDCPVNADVSVQTAFCLNTVANEGKNPFHAMCNTDGTTHGDVNGARDTTCLARGDMADDTCKSRDEVRRVCDGDAYTQTTGLGGSNTNLCTGMSVDLADTYSNLRLECEKSDVGSFADYCDSQDAIGAVQTARNDYCGAKLTDLSEATDNCVSRLDVICTTNDGTAPFAGICGTGTAQQITACEGTVADLPTKGALASDCNDDLLSGAICGMGSNPGTNPFAEICSNMDAIISGFMIDMAQDNYCRASMNAAEGMSSGVCFTIKGTFCDGADATDNPYAPLCGANLLAKESFCEDHRNADSTNMDLCVNSRASVCPSDPFRNALGVDCLNSGKYADFRSAHCSDGRTTGALCNTLEVSNAVCIATGDYANPFAAFCGDATDARSDKRMTIAQVRQTVYSACLANGAPDVCTNTSDARDTLRDTDCVIGQPAKLFAPGCDYTEFRSVEINYCDETGTAWEARCNDVMAEAAVKMARDTACTTYGTTTGGDDSCANRANVRLLCNDNPFTKTTADTSEELCTGLTKDIGGVLYSERRNLCKTTNSSFTQTYCDAEDNSDGGSDTLVKTARDMDCLARGDMADTRCANRANVLGVCDMDAYRQTTGLGGSNTNLCTGMSTTYTDTYSNLRLECEKSDVGSFAEYCDSQDAIGAVQTARNSYCGAKLTNLSEASGQGNCVSRLDAICITNPTAPFAGICGVGITAGQITACEGTVTNLIAKGALASDCNDDLLSGAICGMGSDPGTNPFADICSDMDAIRTGFMKDKAQDNYCRASIIEAEGMSSGVCFNIKGTFCDGVHATDNPYAPLCGANLLAKESFCEDHRNADSTNMDLCVNSRASVCPSDPFRNALGVDCFASGAISYANHRSEQCSDGRTKSPALCNTSLIVTAVCATTGDYANPFAAFCALDTGASSLVNVPDLIQMALDMCDAGNNNAGLCANTTMDRDRLRNTDCVIGQPDKLFADGCDYTEFKPLEVDYCANTGTAWTAICNGVADDGDRVKTARDNACLQRGQSVNITCESRAEIRRVCNDDPFTKPTLNMRAELCTGSTEDIGGVLYSERRRSICETLATTFDTRCGVLNKYGSNTNSQRNAVCHANPFDTNCVNAYLVDDDGKLAFCRDADRNPAGKDNTFCGTDRPLISGACGNNPGDPVCDDDFSDKVTAGDWTRAQPALLRTDPTAENQFLAIAGNEISTEGVTPLGGGDPTVYKLDFSDFTYGGQSLGLSANNGLAYFGGLFAGSRFDYAGIYGTTDLGAPIADDGFSATWAGKFQFAIHSKDFDLKVTFSSTTGTVDGFIKNFTGGFDFLIDGEFDENGVITGGVHLAAFDGDTPTSISNPNGTLSGIIGSDGAVGVFYGTSGYSGGGFVAIPTATGLIADACARDSGDPICSDDDVTKVTASDWERVRESALNTNPTGKNQFLKIAGNEISKDGADLNPSGVGGGGIPSHKTLDFSALTYGGVSLGLDDDNGLADFQGYVNDIRYQYVGIYGTTDLGVPITTSGFSVAWAGKLRISGASVKDFTLAVTFGGTTGTVIGFLTDIKKELDFLIDGEFDANGVITGDVHYAEFTNNLKTATADRNGILSGIIGQEGAVGVFHSNADEDPYRGGFIASAEATRLICAMDSGDPICPDDDVTKVTAKDWQRSFDAPLDTDPDTTLPKAQFLKIADDTISIVGVTGFNNVPVLVPETLDFSEFSYGGESLGLDDNNGFSSFGGTIRGPRYDYAGIYGTTDLGAPIANDIVSATWAAKFQFASHSKDFDLKVTFDGTTGTGTVKAFIVDSVATNDFLIDGEFDANGVITGDTHLMAFNNNVQTSISNPNGILSGIIGSDGAVGVFYGIAADLYSGGFIASAEATRLICAMDSGDPICPDDDVTKVTASDWERSFDAPLNTDPTAKNQFLKIAEKTISTDGVRTLHNSINVPRYTLDFSDITSGGVSLGLSANNGVDASGGFISSVAYYYVGIFGTTDLGAPITETRFSATWDGKIKLYTSSKEFTLDVTFDGTTGTLDAFVVNLHFMRELLIDGEFDANGVITGDIHYAEFTNDVKTAIATPNGILSGIIGSGGVVGVFHGTAAGQDGFPGGFVAAPPPVPVTADTWVSSFTSPALRTTPTAENQFLQIVGTTISTAGTTLRHPDHDSGAGPAPTARTLDFTAFNSGTIPLGLDANDGLAYYRGWFGRSIYSYAGIYASTDLGARIVDSDMNATWAAKLQLDGNSKDFDLTVTFDGTDGTVKTFIENLFSTVHFSIDGRFGANGVISGRVHYDSGTHPASSDNFNGNLSGIIGQDGAVGVYILDSGPSVGVNGGFIAVPDTVNAGDWVDSFTSPALRTTPTAENQFLQLSGKTISRIGTTSSSSSGSGTPVVDTLDFTEFSSAIPLGLDANDGLAYFRGWIEGSGGSGPTRYSYAGIYASTDLGAPITDSGMDATWAGKFLLGGFQPKDFTLDVTFDGTDGTVEAFIENISGNSDFSINGRFGANGVITGGVHYAGFASVTNPTPPTTFNGTLSGIIGQDGAVGVYILDDGINGGFIAAPAR